MHRVQRSDEGCEGRELEERHRVLTEIVLLESQLLRQQVEEERRAGTEESECYSGERGHGGTEGRDAAETRKVRLSPAGDATCSGGDSDAHG